MTRTRLFMLATALLAALVMVAPIATAGAAGGNNTGATAGTQTVGPDFVDVAASFAGATSTNQYYVDVHNATKPLKVSTEDCCVPNDKWGVVLEDLTAGLPPVGTAPIVKTKAGTGSTSAFTGNLGITSPSSTAFNGRALAIVYYARGVDQFSAGMTVRFSSDGVMTVSPRSASGP